MNKITNKKRKEKKTVVEIKRIKDVFENEV